MAAPDLTEYFDNIKTIRENLVRLGKWNPNKPYSSSGDDLTNNYYDETVAGERDVSLKNNSPEKSNAETKRYYDKTVADERKKQKPSGSFIQNQVLNRAKILAKNGALTLLFKAVARKAKRVSDQNISKYYDPDSTKNVGSQIAKKRNKLQQREGSDLETFDTNRKKLGITSGKPADKTNSDFPYRNTEDEIVVPGKTFVENNPDKMVTFKRLSGAENIDDLYAKNEEQGKKVKLFGQARNQNQFKNSLIDGISVFPTPGEDIESHDKIGENYLGDELIFKMGGTPLQKPETFYKAWVPRKRTSENNIGRPSSFSNPASKQNDVYAKKINDLLKQQDPTIGSYKFFIEKLHGRYKDEGSLHPYKKNPVKSRAGELIPKELENRMVFPAYINTYNDGYDSSFESYDFIGRGEPFWAWKSTTRTFTLDFYMMSDVSTQLLTASAKALESEQQSKGGKVNGKDPGGALNNTVNLARTSQDVANIKNGKLFDAAGNAIEDLEITDKEKFQSILDLFPDWGLGTTPVASYAAKGRSGFVQGEISGTPDQLWERVTFLSQCMYGWYRKDGKLKEQPIVRIRISDFFDVTAIITSLQFTQDEFDIDLNISSTVGAIPTGIKVTLSATILHDDEPNSEYRKFYHRKDRDNPTETDQDKKEAMPGVTGDAILNNAQSKSPIQTVPKNLKNRKNSQFPAEAAVYQASMKNLDSSLKNLKVGGGSLKDASKREKLAIALKASLRFLKLAQAYQALEVPETALESSAAKNSMANKALSQEVNTSKLFNKK